MTQILPLEHILILIGALLFLSILASKTSGKLGVPALLLFLGVGMLAGAEGMGGIVFEETWIAQYFGIIALVFILFSGGLETKWESIRPVLKQGLLLSTLGVLLTAGSVGLFVFWLTELTILQSFLVGAIVSSTDAAAVFSILRSKNIGLKGKLRPILELESGSNDPMAYFLTISLVGFLTGEMGSGWWIVPSFFLQMIMGTIVGIGMGKLMVLILNKINLDYDGLYPVLLFSLVLATFAITAFVGGNGFLSVYIAGLLMGNRSFIHKKSLIQFYDGQAWLMQIVMFIMLGLLVNPSQVIPVMGTGLLIALFLMFVARPIGVFASMAFFKTPVKEKLFLSWLGLRGAVPIILATYPLIAGLPEAATMFNIVFFIVILSVALQGTTLTPVAKFLGVQRKEPPLKLYPLEQELTDHFRKELIRLEVPEQCKARGRTIVDLDLPATALIVLMRRNDEYITPRGNTVLEAKDRLWVMADDREDIPEILKKLDCKKVLEGPLPEGILE